MENINKDMNEGGLNGFGNNKIDTNSDEFVLLRKAIVEDSRKQTPKQIAENRILAMHLKIIALLESNSN